MCDPLTIGSAALTAFGTFQQYQSQKKAQKGVQQAIARNDEANERLRRQSQSRTLDAAGSFDRTKFDETQAAETEKLDKSYADSLSQGQLPGEYYGGRQSENTQKYMQTKSNQTTDFSKEIAEALARMRGFDAGMRTNNIGINRAGETVAMNNSFQQGNNAVLPLQIEAAKQKASNPLADIMVGIGGAGLSAGLSGSAATGPLSSQSSFSRTLAGMKDVPGPINGFAGTGFNLV